MVGPGIRSGMAILYENPREVGADRIVNAVAAYERVKGGVIVVDFGTATTFDCVTPKGEYLGGVIAPGIQISADALFSRAAKLHPVEIARPRASWGATRCSRCNPGIVYGYAGLVDGVVERIKTGARLSVRGHRDRAVWRGSSLRRRRRSSESTTLSRSTGLRLLYERNVDA